MRLTHLGLDRDLRTVVILGAGATAGARLTSRPPLGRVFVDGDFFQQLQYFSATSADSKFKSDAREFLHFLAETYGQGDHSLEAIFGQLDVTRQFEETTRALGPGRNSRVFERRVAQLTSLIVNGLRQSLGEVAPQTPSCDRHRAVLGSMGVDDAVVSFNYDLLADRALLEGAGSKFSAHLSYGFPPLAVASEWAPIRRGKPYKNHIKLLKPHGSLNWKRTGDGISIASTEYALDPGAVAIVPPQFLKRFQEEPYSAVWRATREALRSSRALVIAGYSLPPSDIYTAAALRLEVQELDLLCIANPDPLARDRIRDVLRSAISSDTRVVNLDSFAQLSERLGAKTNAQVEIEANANPAALTKLIDERIAAVAPSAVSRAMRLGSA